jgi:SAP domain-containing ribonucleoprotein
LQDDELEEEKSLLDSTHDLLKSPSESVKSTSPESNPAPPPKKVSLKRNISISVPVVESKPAGDSEATSEGEPDKKVVKISTISELDRLEMRAKKFSGGVAAVASSVSSEDVKDKLSARAARFGVTAPDTKPAAGVTSSVSLDVLKKRAERFGSVLVPELKKSEFQEKLQKRQERFGITEKAAITAPKASVASTNPEYAEKALKRLERFKQSA